MSGRPEPVLTSEKSEIAQGDEAAVLVEKNIGLLENPELVHYVDSVGRRLASHSPRKNLTYSFHVVEMVEPNAFALPGGHVYVSRGLLALINSESELAAILGHELGHVAARHSVQRQTASIPLVPLQIASALGAVAAAVVSPALGRMVADAGSMPAAFAMAAYSREQERNADRLGQEFAAAAGFDPAALGSLMNTLTREEVLSSNEGDRDSFLLSHPSTPQRSEDANLYARELSRASDPPAPRARESFLREVAGIVVGEGAGEGIIIENKFVHPELGIALEFPLGWKLQNFRDAVTAERPDGDGRLTLEIVSRGSDPMIAARALNRELTVDTPPAEFTIQGNSAVRSTLRISDRGGDRQSSLTWIAFDDIIYRVTGISSTKTFPSLRAEFEKTADSFHALEAAERAAVTENRLRLVRALPGEDLEALGQRTDNRWSVARTALTNGVSPDAPLPSGFLIKIAHPEPYATKESRSTEEPSAVEP